MLTHQINNNAHKKMSSIDIHSFIGMSGLLTVIIRSPFKIEEINCVFLGNDYTHTHSVCASIFSLYIN